MKRFFYGMTASGTDKRIGGGYVPGVLISAGVLWSRSRRCFIKWNPPRYDELLLDTGGFSFHVRHSDYPFSLGDYAKLARHLKATWAATLDYPCEPKVNREVHATNLERIAKSVEWAKESFRSHPDVPWLPVIQGYTAAEYLACIDLYEEAGLLRPYMAIGSLCARVRRDKTWEVLRVISRRLPTTRLHGFGISLTLLKDQRIRRALHSADSQAWRFFDHYDSTVRRWIWRPRTMAAQVGNYPKYAAKIDRLLEKPTRPLASFGVAA